MHKEAARNYHTATVYFRVLESMVPRLTSRVHAVSPYIVSIHCSTSSPLIFSNGREFCRPPSHHLYRPLYFHTTSNLLIVNHSHFLSSLVHYTNLLSSLYFFFPIFLNSSARTAVSSSHHIPARFPCSLALYLAFILSSPHTILVPFPLL